MEKRSVPKLRFKGFEDKWEEKKLGDLVSYKKGYAFKTEECTSEGIRVVKISDTTTTSINKEGNTFIKKDDYDKFKEWELLNDDILVSTVGSRPPLYSSMVGKVVKVPRNCEGALLNQNLVKLKPKNLINNKFLYNALKKPKYTKHIENICRGNANQVSITLEDLFEYRIVNPSLEEQTKIANFLSNVDKIIEEQEGKVKDLELYKKGMMQKIFKQEIRFKDDNGKDYSKWETTNIEEISQIKMGFTPSTKDDNAWGGGVEWLSIAGMTSKYIYDGNKKISRELLGKRKLVPQDTLIMSFKLTIGRLAIVKRELMTNEAICQFYWKNKNILNEYMYGYLSTVNISSFGCRAAKGITLNTESLNSIVVKLPCLEEQTKIANFLSNIDNIIEEENKKLKRDNAILLGKLSKL